MTEPLIAGSSPEVSFLAIASDQPVFPMEPGRPETGYPEYVRTNKKVIFSEMALIRGCAEKQTEPGCGKIRYIRVCSKDRDHPRHFQHNYCNEALCPVCFKKYLPRIATGAADRFLGYWQINRRGKPYHLVVSPPSGVHYQNMKEAYAAGHKMLKSAGCQAAITIYHPYRLIPEYERAIEEYRKATGSKEKRWELARKDVLGIGGLGFYVYYSPHFHALAFGWLKNSDQFERETGWIYRKIRYIRGGEDVVGLIVYLQTHSAWEYGKHTLRYWGELSYARLARKRVGKKAKPVLCEVCGALVHAYTYDEKNDRPVNLVKDRIMEWVYSYIYWKRGTPEPYLDKFGKVTAGLGNLSAAGGP